MCEALHSRVPQPLAAAALERPLGSAPVIPPDYEGMAAISISCLEAGGPISASLSRSTDASLPMTRLLTKLHPGGWTDRRTYWLAIGLGAAAMIALASLKLVAGVPSWAIGAAASVDLQPIIADVQASGGLSLRQIAAGLNQRGIPTARGGTWSAVQVRRVLHQSKV